MLLFPEFLLHFCPHILHLFFYFLLFTQYFAKFYLAIFPFFLLLLHFCPHFSSYFLLFTPFLAKFFLADFPFFSAFYTIFAFFTQCFSTCFSSHFFFSLQANSNSTSLNGGVPVASTTNPAALAAAANASGGNPASASGGNSASKRKEIYKYEAPWTVYSMNWSVRPDKRFKLGEI